MLPISLPCTNHLTNLVSLNHPNNLCNEFYYDSKHISQPREQKLRKVTQQVMAEQAFELMKAGFKDRGPTLGFSDWNITEHPAQCLTQNKCTINMNLILILL